MEAKNQPLVSVIIPFYNDDRFLVEAVDSVLQQTYLNWELLLIDDGSKEGCTAIAKKIAEAHPDKIFYLEHEGHANKGTSASRNAGVKLAKGDLIAFLDADDVWLPEKLQHQVSIFQDNPGLGMTAEASEYWYNWNDPPKLNRLVKVGAAERVYQPFELSKLLYPLKPQPSACPSALMMTREAFARAGGLEEAFAKEYAMYEDQAFLSKVYLNEKVYISAACHNYYRIREGSIVQTAAVEGYYHIARKFFLTWFENYLQQRQIQEPTIHKLLEEALMPYRSPKQYFISYTLPKQLKHLVRRGLRKLKLA